MAEPITLPFGPFAQGMNDITDPALLGPDQATYAIGVDMSAGTLRGMFSPGTAVTTVTAGSVSLTWAGKNAWVANSYSQWACNDAPTAAGAGVTYLTQQTGGVASNPTIQQGASSYRLGIPVPAAPTATQGGADGNPSHLTRSFVAVALTSDGQQSNASGSVSWSYDGYVAIITAPASNDPRVASFAIYATDPLNNRSGYFYLTTINPSSTYQAGDGSDVDTSRPLNWAPGGNPNLTASPSDHSVAPNLTIISDAIHSVTQGAGTAGSGILFGAVGNIVYWSMLGYSNYWPTSNYLGLPEPVEAMTTSGAQTLVFTASSIYSFTGYSDTAINIQKIPTDIGVLTGCGKTVSQSPFGVIFTSREGIALFDGSSTRIISEGIISPVTLANGGFKHGRYYDRCYFLFGAGYTLVMDMRGYMAHMPATMSGPIKVTREPTIATASHNTPYSPTGGAPGLYICDSAGNIKPWRPTDVTNLAGSSRDAWTWTTGKQTASAPSSPKIWRRVFYRGVGPATFSFYRDAEANALFTKAIPDLSLLPGCFWLPVKAQARSLTVKIQGTATNSELYDFRIEAEVRDGA